MKSKIIVIVGPTASGKSDMATRLAKEKYEKEGVICEVISADSRQIYKGLDIGSGKITEPEKENVKHFGLDIVEPKKISHTARAFGAGPTQNTIHNKFTAEDWAKYAREKIEIMLKENKLPIICGGTGLYVDALIYGFTENPAPNSELRKEIENKNILEIQNEIRILNPEFFESLNNSEKNNRERLVRKLEILKLNENKININHKKELLYDVEFIILKPEKEILENKIRTRLEKRLENNILVNEIKNLLNGDVDPDWLMSLGLEYKYVTMFVLGQINYEEMLNTLNTKIFQYAKRQLLWNKKYEGLI